MILVPEPSRADEPATIGAGQSDTQCERFWLVHVRNSMQTVKAQTIPLPPNATFSDDLLKSIPKLRAYAFGLCRATGRGNDLA